MEEQWRDCNKAFHALKRSQSKVLKMCTSEALALFGLSGLYFSQRLVTALLVMKTCLFVA